MTNFDLEAEAKKIVPTNLRAFIDDSRALAAEMEEMIGKTSLANQAREAAKIFHKWNCYD
jgi:hypothetical protein